MIGKFLNRISKSINFVAEKIQKRIEYNKCFRVVSLKSPQNKGNALLSYRIEPFLLKPGEPIPNDHTWYWECLQIAQTFLDLGYNVDVIQFHNEKFEPQKDYAFFVDIRDRLEGLAPKLNPDCVKILHVDIANMTFRNAAECNRHLELQQRRGVTLRPQRYEVPNLGIEYADCATVLGNDFTVNTFKYTNKPTYRIPISTPVVYPSPVARDFAAIRKNFLWFGSGGLVLKGLDLALEAFAQMPDCHLTVCGPISKDAAFTQAFYKELYETPNIHTHGWIDINSPEFMEITNNCLGLVYPSACEGQSGGVITCLHAGLIPILSYESGVDVHDFGVILANCSIPEIIATVQRISNLPVETLHTMSQQAWAYARANHTRDKFAEVYRHVIEEILNHNPKIQPTQTVNTHHKQQVFTGAYK